MDQSCKRWDDKFLRKENLTVGLSLAVTRYESNANSASTDNERRGNSTEIPGQ